VDLPRHLWWSFAPSPQSEEDHQIDCIGIGDSKVYGVKDEEGPAWYGKYDKNNCFSTLSNWYAQGSACAFAVTNLNQVDNNFHPCQDSVHVDKKWFFISEKTLVFYIPGEKVPEGHHTQNKDHLIKVMFLCAIAQPWHNAAGKCILTER
jgi:hypothetical protein